MADFPHAAWLLRQFDRDSGGQLRLATGAEANIARYFADKLVHKKGARSFVDEVLRVVAVVHAEGATDLARFLFTTLHEIPAAQAVLIEKRLSPWGSFAGQKLDKAPNVEDEAPEGSMKVGSKFSGVRRIVRG